MSNMVSSSGGGFDNPAADDIQNSEFIMIDDMTTPNPSLAVPGLYDMSKNCQHAVSIRQASKTYGCKKKPNQILQNLNMRVAKGSIYGLLGASGCGKTTLLSCIVGRRHLDSGEILVLGGAPGTKGSGVPGKRVGFMPQEIALFGEFTIRETMMYFGWIFDMDTEKIDEKMHFLIQFLDLPPQERLVENLSSGQQRRVSFAVALIHDPELLILDEPTVGVDPLLRQKIWDHLVQITKNGNKTVIITTHYIEEARRAHTIGLMRSGKLLAEQTPQALLSMYNCPNLEEVFLKLSRNQGQNCHTEEDKISSDILPGQKGELQERHHITNDIHDQYYPNGTTLSSGDGETVNSVELSSNIDSSSYFDFTSTGRLRALLQKNVLRMWRNVGMMMFIFALPVIQGNLFCLSIGRDPTNLKVAIVNQEMNWENKSCSSDQWSCDYLNYLNEEAIIKEYYETPELANGAISEGNAWGTLYMAKNFTVNLKSPSVEKMIDHSDIRIWLDMSNQQVGFFLSRSFQSAYEDFVKDLLRNGKIRFQPPRPPIEFLDPIFGSMDSSYTNFVAPGIVLSIIFFLAVSLTSSAFIVERTEGLLDRSWVAGVSPGEILLSHIITQFFVMFIQTALVHVFIIFVYNVDCNGDVGWVIALTVLQGLCGMCFGFLVSSVCELERNAMQLAMGSFYPTLLLSGIMWPAEGMPMVLQYISKVLPMSLATSSLRSMMIRGWSITQFDVYIGFISTIIWIIIFLTMSLFVLKFKRG